MSAAAGPQAHSPTQAELEKEYIEAQGALRPSFLLLSKPEYITTKREDFRYALRRTLPRFFEMLRVYDMMVSLFSDRHLLLLAVLQFPLFHSYRLIHPIWILS